MISDTPHFSILHNWLTVFFEKSIKEFHEFPQHYIHRFEQQSDSGLSMELLQKYVFIPLDIFRERHQNITNKTEAWLTFLSTDRPEQIIQLIKRYPQFREMYEETKQLLSQALQKIKQLEKEKND